MTTCMDILLEWKCLLLYLLSTYIYLNTYPHTTHIRCNKFSEKFLHNFAWNVCLILGNDILRVVFVHGMGWPEDLINRYIHSFSSFHSLMLTNRVCHSFLVELIVFYRHTSCFDSIFHSFIKKVMFIDKFISF